MATLQVDTLRFMFQPSVAALKYDESQHFLTVWQPRTGQSAMDVVAFKMTAHPDSTWLIEAKDFRVVRGTPKPSNLAGLAQSVRKKALDTRSGLQDAARNA